MDATIHPAHGPAGSREKTTAADVLTITGGTPLRGRVRVGGSKNAALPMLAAALTGDGPTTLRRVPELTDTAAMVGLLRGLGASASRDGGAVTVDPAGLAGRTAFEPDADRVGALRGAVCLLGPLLARASMHGGGSVRLARVGGCDLGPRPIDRHLAGLEAMGATVTRDAAGVTVTVTRLRGATVDLSAPPAPGLPAVPTVTGTANLLCAAAVAEGETTLRGAAREPEVVALGRLLIAMGAKISGLGTSEIRVTGVPRLRGVGPDDPAGAVPGDRIEAATWMIAAAATGGRVVVDGADPAELSAVEDVLRAAGAIVSVCGIGTHRSVRVIAPAPPNPFDAVSAAYPGLPTDALPQLGALAAAAGGVSRLSDGVFPGRTAHLPGLRRFGATATVRDGEATVRADGLSAADVTAPDLRAAAALLIAGLAADGTSRLHAAGVLLRGYERPVEKLRALGAEVSVGDAPASGVGEPPARRPGRGGWRAVRAGRILGRSRPVPVEPPACPAAA